MESLCVFTQKHYILSSSVTEAPQSLGSGTLIGGISSSIAGGSFWDGARQGFITATLNHVVHQMYENGYDEDGNQINNNGGDTTDYLYDKDGNIISSTSVQFISQLYITEIQCKTLIRTLFHRISAWGFVSFNHL